jgi:intracellular septation protein
MFMKFLFDFFPVLLFFLAYKQYGSVPVELMQLVNQIPMVELVPKEPKDSLIFATLILIFATLLQNILHWLFYRRLEKMHIVSLGILVVFGSMTVVTKDPDFLKWKVTLFNWVFALVLFGSLFIGVKPLMERMMSNAIKVPRPIWRQTTIYAALFFALVGCVNLVVAFYFPGENDVNWVNFKLFGMFGLTMVFMTALVFYLSKHAIEESNTEES